LRCFVIVERSSSRRCIGSEASVGEPLAERPDDAGRFAECIDSESDSIDRHSAHLDSALRCSLDEPARCVELVALGGVRIFGIGDQVLQLGVRLARLARVLGGIAAGMLVRCEPFSDVVDEELDRGNAPGVRIMVAPDRRDLALEDSTTTLCLREQPLCSCSWLPTSPRGLV
jgi:hypothetical protein